MNQFLWNSIISVIFVRHIILCDNTWLKIADHPAWRMLDNFECGFSASDRIIGGLNAALGQFPWVTRLGYSRKGEKDLNWMCGGALLTDLHVVTAAHCVIPSGEDYNLSLIRVGEYDTKTNPDCQLYVCAPPIQDRKVRSVKIHPNFNVPAYHNDLAMITLDMPVQLNDYVLPICLPRAGQLKNLILGELLLIAGWGKTNMTTEEYARILQYVAVFEISKINNSTNDDSQRKIFDIFKVPIVTPETCDSFGRGFKLLKTEICAGAQQHKDACVGDSGGPFMKVFDTIDGPKNFLIGVVSFGPTICGIRKPGVYTSVPHFLKWILDNMIS